MTITPEEDLPPQPLHYLREPQAANLFEPFYRSYSPEVPIAIDFGASNVRAGLVNSPDPNNVFPTLVSKCKDKRLGLNLTLVGNDIFREVNNHSGIRTNAKSPYDGAHITNWDIVENIIDYSLEHLGVQSLTGTLQNPVVLSEPVACPLSQRKSMYELIFETYHAPKVALGIDSLFSYHANSLNPNGLVISVGSELTHVIPMLQGKGVLLQCKRIDWGGNLALLFLQRLLALKYPYFPTRLSNHHTNHILFDHAYVLKDYLSELSNYLNMDVLEQKDVVIQVPVEVAVDKSKKSEEELAKQAERRREQGRRLQEQARKKRLEKLIQKEQEFEYYSQLKDTLSLLSKSEADRRSQSEDFKDFNDFNKYVDNLEKSLRKARSQDVDDGTEDDVPNPEEAWPLVLIPDENLSEEQIKDKRRQKLLKANYDARMRAKEEKKREEEEKAQFEREQQEWRERDLDGWCTSKRLELAQLIAGYKKRIKLQEAMKDRKSMAAQQRMKNIADLANDSAANGRKRRKNVASATIDNDPNDTFGANDDDWNAYRDISNANLEEEQEEATTAISALEEELMKHDPNFHYEDTLAASETFDWKNSVLHKFIHGPRQSLTLAMQAEGHDPQELANHPEIIRRNHQLHINVERIRVPEIYFQPHIAGLDLAGIPEVVQNLLYRNFDGNFGVGGQLRSLVENVFVTGGGSLVPNFTDRLRAEIQSFLPVGTPFNVTHARDPIGDSWRGMQKWAASPESQNSYVSRQEYEEYGAEYIKEHGLGNISLRNF